MGGWTNVLLDLELYLQRKTAITLPTQITLGLVVACDNVCVSVSVGCDTSHAVVRWTCADSNCDSTAFDLAASFACL